MGILAIGIAFLLGLPGGVPAGDIIAGFPTGLFINLFGMFFFFSIAKTNGALDLLSKKLLLNWSELLQGVKRVALITSDMSFQKPASCDNIIELKATA